MSTDILTELIPIRILFVSLFFSIIKLFFFSIILLFLLYIFFRARRLNASFSETVAILEVRIEQELHMTDEEALILYRTAKTQRKQLLPYAEAGVYKGGSAKLICKAKGLKSLHLFDTFEGLPNPSQYDKKESGSAFQKGEFKESLKNVKNYLKNEKNVYFHVGNLQKTTKYLGLGFSFVHLDLDEYESTKSALEFFYPQLCAGGILISHDYSTSEGVKKAFDEYFQTEKLIILPTSQVLVEKGEQYVD